MRCSTVTPGKFATFWRRPVSRLNSVDLPEFGGPTIATICRRVGIAGGGGRVATEQPWQSLINSVTLSLEVAFGPSRAAEPLQIRPPETPSDRRLEPSGPE